MRIEKQILNFNNTIKKEADKRGITDFETSVVKDSDDIVYFVFHNRYDLERCADFVAFASNKMNEYFFSHGIFEVCFTHNYELEKNIANSRQAKFNT